MVARNLVASLVLLAGCGGSGLKLTPIRSANTRPSNVAIYFKVQKSTGDPIGGLTADKFKIYEDGQLISQYESKQTILNPEVAASYYTLLLMDMSGSIADSGAADTLVDAATAFTDRVEKSQKVGVYAFDGSENLHPIAPFSTAGSAKAAIKSLSTFKPTDPSTNLNGAVIKAIAELENQLSHAEHPMHFGTIVVFSDGTDRAARVTKSDMRKAVRDSKFDIFAIGLGPEMNQSDLEDVGKSGTAKAVDKDAVVKAFDEIAEKIEASTRAYYLLSYCSPARAGKHELRIEATWADGQGKDERGGSLTSDFDATGFSPGCDPNQPPNFDIHKGDAVAPPEEKSAKSTAKGEKSREATAKKVASKPAAQPSPPPAPQPAPPAKTQEVFQP